MEEERRLLVVRRHERVTRHLARSSFFKPDRSIMVSGSIKKRKNPNLLRNSVHRSGGSEGGSPGGNPRGSMGGSPEGGSRTKMKGFQSDSTVIMGRFMGDSDLKGFICVSSALPRP